MRLGEGTGTGEAREPARTVRAGRSSAARLSPSWLCGAPRPRAALAMAARSGFQRYVRREPASAALRMYRWAGGYKTGGSAFDALPGAWREQMLAHAPATLREIDQMIRPYPTRAAIRSIACSVTVIEGDLSDPTFAIAVGFVMRLLPLEPHELSSTL